MWRVAGLFALAFAVDAAQAVELTAVRGAVQIERNQQVISGQKGTQLRVSDTLIVPADAEAVIQFDDGARMAVRPGSRVLLKRLYEASQGGADRSEVMQMIQGALRYISAKSPPKNDMSFETNTASVGIRGTDLEIAIAEAAAGSNAGTYLKVNEGAAVLAGLDGSTVSVEPGQVAFGAPDSPPGQGATRSLRPLGRRVSTVPPNVFRSGALDAELR